MNSECTYIGETECLHERKSNTKSSTRKANASFLPYIQHISRCSNLKEPLLKVYPFYYESGVMLRKLT